jgi:hypothetical protein
MNKKPHQRLLDGMPPHIAKKVDKMIGNMKEVYNLAMESWEGCDGCDENDKYFFIKGFQTGYNRAKPDELSDELRYKDGTPIRKHNSPKLQAIEMEISDEEIEQAGEEWCHAIGEDGFVNSGDDYDIHELPAFIAGAKWYREQLKNND